MRFETTIAQSGVHQRHRPSPRRSGQSSIVPAPAATGIVFERSDLDYFQIPASYDHVAKVSYATSLMRQGVSDLDDRTSC